MLFVGIRSLEVRQRRRGLRTVQWRSCDGVESSMIQGAQKKSNLIPVWIEFRSRLQCSRVDLVNLGRQYS